MKLYKVIIKDIVNEEIVETVNYVLDHKDNVSAEIKAMTEEELALIGWYVLEDVPQPPDTSTTTYDLTVETVEGVPHIVWVERPKTNEELARDSILLQIDSLNALMGVAGVVDLGTARGIKASTNTEINANPAKYIKAVADILIELLKAQRRASGAAISNYSGIE